MADVNGPTDQSKHVWAMLSGAISCTVLGTDYCYVCVCVCACVCVRARVRVCMKAHPCPTEHFLLGDHFYSNLIHGQGLWEKRREE